MEHFTLKRTESTSNEGSDEIASTSTAETVSITNANPEDSSEPKNHVPYTLDNSKSVNLIENIPKSSTLNESPIINNTSENISINHTSTIKLCEYRETLDKNGIDQIGDIEGENDEP
ncbi:9359_t:CDS:2, partial [Dentiscutata erythropus]